ncbi:AraC family transcriptional regulator [Oceanobacillus piezotolerans]|uniref:AraC family transcriptional regulator n=1 Tax=Oceanobacillus piezotolerans TaxID=2448030 RepID=A0A498DGX5_9BACI|nr:AraC family transcriptional regulator [Oceanobacillus piezotolerans]RLL47739.1 AraC family transcriptional regulator [Oceanobacillus piezotolerans]
MEQSKLIATALKLHHVTDLNVYVVDHQGELLYQQKTISIPSFMPGAELEDIFSFYSVINQEDQVYTYINEWGLHFHGYSFQIEDRRYCFIIGPYFDMIPNVYQFSRQYHLGSRQTNDLRLEVEKIHVLTAAEADSFASVLQQVKHLVRAETKPIIIDLENKTVSSERKKVETSNKVEADLVELRYKIENEFMYAVENGDREAALKLISSNNVLFSFSERFTNQPLRGMKNNCIILNTLLRSAARRSHVPATILHRVSEKFAYEIENSSQLATMNQLQDKMIIEYCQIVAEHTLKGYSSITQKVLEYLLNHYDEQIDKEELASKFYTHPSHLSRKFKQETNMTITAYQQMLRINHAKHLLKTETLTIEEIAWIVGYEDASYFSRVFKKEIGITPTQYREYDN